ncbi:hypothetical protein, partial [Streptomyces sp. AV19]|uniref:hypothetical protein n=1 Tax=Streptomyces sp. AV19 TaxID=2793068 RepID=UPI001F40B230
MPSPQVRVDRITALLIAAGYAPRVTDHRTHVHIESELPDALPGEVLRGLMAALLPTDSWSFVHGAKSGHAIGITELFQRCRSRVRTAAAMDD